MTRKKEKESQMSREKEKEQSKRKQRNWDESYAALVAYHKKFGTANVPQRYAADTALACWVGTQRSYERKLTADQRKKLVNLGFEFTRMPNSDERWKERFENLKQYHGENGHTMVPNSHPTLGKWVGRQREQYWKGLLKKDRHDMLESIGFVWRMKKSKDQSTATHDKKWAQQYEKLANFREESGQWPSVGHQGGALYKWLLWQRKLNRDDLLRPDRKELLDNLGMDWFPKGTISMQQKWDQQFEKMRAYKKQHAKDSSCEIPEGLSGWVTTQKMRFRDGDIDPERAERLLEAGFCFKTEEDRSWRPRYEELKAWTASSDSTGQNSDLARWIKLQRVLARHGTYLESRKELLDKIGFEWNDSEAQTPVVKKENHYKESAHLQTGNEQSLKALLRKRKLPQDKANYDTSKKRKTAKLQDLMRHHYVSARIFQSIARPMSSPQLLRT